MGKILEAFADDSILTGSRSFKDNLEYSTAINKAVATEEKLLAMLNENGKELLDEFSSAYGEMTSLSCTDKFVYGYRLGVLMTMEVFTESDSLIRG